MTQENFVRGETEDEIWQQISRDFEGDKEVLTYNTTIVYKEKKVTLDIDIDPGGGFESGFATTTFVSWLDHVPPYRFAIHEQHFTDEIGKFFGMEDVIIGYKDFDEKLIIKTHDKAIVRQLFASPQVRAIFLELNDFTFGIHHRKTDDVDNAYLELYLEDGITDVAILKRIFSAFYAVLEIIEKQGKVSVDKIGTE